MDQIAEAAADRALLIGHDPGEAVVVSARSALWRVFCDHDPLLGWWAGRVDRDRRLLTEETGWLGAIDLEPDQIIDNLLSRPRLPTDLIGHKPWMETGHPWSRLTTDTWYARCPTSSPATLARCGCGLTGPVDIVTCTITAGSAVDLSQPIQVNCQVCGQDFDGRHQAAPRTTTKSCPRCQALVVVPAGAAHMRCGRCRFGFLAADLTHRTLARLHQLTHRPDLGNVTDLPTYPRRSTWTAPPQPRP